MEDFDQTTSCLVREFLSVYHDMAGCDDKRPEEKNTTIFRYDGQHLQYPLLVLNNVLSSLLSVAAITARLSVDSMSRKLGIIAAFTATFSLLRPWCLHKREHG